MAGLLGLIGVLVFGILPSQDGSGADYWNTHWVVIAQVEGVAPRGKPGGHEITLDVKSTITGAWDAAQTPGLSARVFVDPAGIVSYVRSVPPVGSFAAFLIEKKLKGGFRIPSAGITFSPSNSAIVPLNGLDDPKLNKLIENIHKLRTAKSESDSTTRK